MKAPRLKFKAPSPRAFRIIAQSVGILLIAAGLWATYPPASLIVTGGILLVSSVAATMHAMRPPTDH